MSKYIVIHQLNNQSVGCVNRDEYGQAKSAEVGGYLRGRRSSQNLKRPIRLAVEGDLKDYSMRTRKYADTVVSNLVEKGIEKEIAVKATAGCLCIVHSKDVPKNNIKKGDPKLDASGNLDVSTMAFFSENELKVISDKIFEALSNSTEVPQLKTLAKEAQERLGSSIILFGRMFADNKDLSVEAVSSYSHALTTNAIEEQSDFFTAMDDLSEDSGSGMMGDSSFNTGCFYSCAVLNVSELSEHVGEDTAKITKAWIKGVCSSFPTAKKNSMFCNNLPGYIRIEVIEDAMPISLWDAFDRPVKASGNDGLLEASIKALETHAENMNRVYGNVRDYYTINPKDSGSDPLKDTIDKVVTHV